MDRSKSLVRSPDFQGAPPFASCDLLVKISHVLCLIAIGVLFGLALTESVRQPLVSPLPWIAPPQWRDLHPNAGASALRARKVPNGVKGD